MSFTKPNLQQQTVQWAEDNNVLLQHQKNSTDEALTVDSYHLNSDSVQSSDLWKLVGVTIDSQLLFSVHVDDIAMCSSFKLYSMRRFKRMEASEKCLLGFIFLKLLSLINTYAAPAWSSLITKGSMEKLEKIQKSSLSIISPDTSYILATSPFQLYTYGLTVTVPSTIEKWSMTLAIHWTQSSVQTDAVALWDLGDNHMYQYAAPQNFWIAFSLSTLFDNFDTFFYFSNLLFENHFLTNVNLLWYKSAMVYERDINKSLSSIYQSLGLYSLPSHVSPLNKKKIYPAFLPNRKLKVLC